MQKIGASAFNHCRYLKEVQLNEGLERLGEYEILDGNEYEGQVFRKTAIRHIALPSTLKSIEAGTF